MKRFNAAPYCLALIATALLSACSGGASVTANPNLQATNSAQVYSGPAPATADVQAFETNLWVNISPTNRCGNCHKAGGQVPQFARADDINLAYAAALTVVNLSQPETSTMVVKVGGGHNCWLASAQACADILTTWISNWAGGSSASTGGTQIQLVAPPLQTVGQTKVYPTDPTLFSQTVYPVVTQWCSRCHSESAASPQSPYFASANLEEAYLAAQPKMDLNTPTNSRFYQRLAIDSHNCWGSPVSCPNSAATMLAAIQAFANGVQPTAVDPTLIVSGALGLTQGIVASGGGRYDAHDIAKWMFKETPGTSTAFDTSGVDPGMDLTLSGDAQLISGWGITFGPAGGRAQASTSTSTKLLNMIGVSGQYSIELWMNPANVTQTKAEIASYSGGDTTRNFTLTQNAFEFAAYGRSSGTDLNGAPPLNTALNPMLIQAALQHVVVTYDPTNGRKVYLNGVYTGDTDTVTGGALNNWDSSFAFLLGNETSGDRPWQGTLRFAAIHDVALTQQQVQQNFAAGVGAVYDLLFDVSGLINVPQSYIMFSGSQYDSYSYLFARPTFINLNPNYVPSGNLPIQSIRIGINGAEAAVDQAYIPLNVNVNASDYSATTGQLLSPLGTVILLENGAATDQFFLTFGTIGTLTRAYPDPAPPTPTPVITAAPSDIGVRVFDEVNATMASQTGVSPGLSAVNTLYQSLQQQLPSVSDISSVSAAAQIGISQLAMQYCQALVNDPVLGPSFFPGMNFSAAPSAAFGTTAGMDQIITPLYNNLIGQNLASQPPDVVPTNDPVRQELYNLITGLSTGSTTTPVITMAACTAVLGSATMLVK